MNINPTRTWTIALLILITLAGTINIPAKAADLMNSTLTGEVLCSGTSTPARFARVEAVSDNKAGMHVYETKTGLNGRFKIVLPPGLYYLAASYPGYIDELRSNPRRILVKLSHRTRQTKSSNLVKVEPDSTAEITVSIERGATISGKLFFSDGSPAPGITTEAILLKSEGCPDDNCLNSDKLARPVKTTTSDDQGNFRLSGLQAGAYLIETILPLKKSKGWYYGSTSIPSNATVLDLALGEQFPGVEVNIPVNPRSDSGQN